MRKNLEVNDLRSMCLLQLAQASHATFAACAKYQCLHLKELEIICSMAMDECEEADTLMKEVEWQASEVKHILDRKGFRLIDHTTCLFLESGVDSEDDNSSDWSARGFSQQAGSPTSSPGTSQN